MSIYNQDGYTARFEWGLNGSKELCPVSDVIIIIDVLSFTTGVDIATSRGATVYPYYMNDESITSYAEEVKAQAVVDRKDMNEENPFSLSPRSLMKTSAADRIVVPSPNGASLSRIAIQCCPVVIAGCLRNAHVVAKKAMALGETISVIAAGELWNYTEGFLRPSFEDLVGAGAILGELQESRKLSPEAMTAVGAFNIVSSRLEKYLMESASGRELLERGYGDDIRVAAQLNSSHTVPMIVDGAFVDTYEMSGEEGRDEDEVIY